MTSIVGQTISIAQIIENCKNATLYVKNGYYLKNVPTLAECNVKSGEPNVFTGSVYQSGNESKSYINLSNLGTFHGNLVLIDAPESELEILYNYLTSLIPGQYPPISGPFSSTEVVYSLDSILAQTEEPNVFFCKILGLGIGNILSYGVANASQNAMSNLAENFLNDNTIQSTTSNGGRTVTIKTPLIRQSSYSNISPEYIYPTTETGTNFYMAGFDWERRYGISQINGTNIFPTFGWGGARIGSITPKTFQFQQDSLFNYPSSLLEIQPNNPLGLIYSGQGVQLSSYPSTDPIVRAFIEFNQRNKKSRVYQDKLSNNDTISLRKTGIQPYQQGRGVYEYVSREPEYSSGSIRFINVVTTFGPEGCQPGRNNAFMGVALTDYYSFNLNLNNQESASTTSQDTRKVTLRQVQSQQAHNAPLVYYESNDANNTYNPIPWNSLNAYVGTTTSSSSNIQSENTPILNEGITTMVISGAYPLYRGSGFAEFSGMIGDFIAEIKYMSRYLSQYYCTSEFWNPDFNGEAVSPEIREADRPPIAPELPYQIKGARIILYEGQRVNAGSYIYSTIGMTGNVNVSQFYGPSAKQLLLTEGYNRVLIGDLYSKYQSNQGGLIVMVTTDDYPVPMIPPNAQPIGIILEDIIGTGTPTEAGGQTEYARQFDITSDIQTVPDFETTLQVQNREVLVQLFPMSSQPYLSGFPTTYGSTSTGFATTVGSDYLLNDAHFFTPNAIIYPPAAPMYAKIRGMYTIPDCRYAYYYAVQTSIERNLPIQHSIRDKQLANDWPGPQSSLFNLFVT